MNSEKFEQLNDLTKKVISEFEAQKDTLNKLPIRIIHGDPKINNFRLDASGEKIICLLDLDTLSRNIVVIDIGDALRSFCMTKDEGGKIYFNEDIFESFIKGYLHEAHFINEEEKGKILEGVMTVTLELAARYIMDAYEEKYFKLDSLKFNSLYEQNKMKASELISLLKDIKYKEKKLKTILSSYLNQ